jgi:hypothetical protein
MSRGELLCTLVLDYVMFTFPLFRASVKLASRRPMTPTRTDRTVTTPRRRAFNSISLNNTHSDVHSSEKAGRGACSTVASRVNNEQRSNNTRSGHNREQLINWLMSKDAVASCFIKDVLSMSESENAGGTRLPAWLLSQLNKRHRSPPLLSRSCTLQINLLGCGRSWSYSVRATYCLHT